MSRSFVTSAVFCALIVVLGTPSVRSEEYDAVKLNKDLIGNEIKAASFMGQTIEVSGRYYGNVKVGNKDAYLVTFQNFAGIGECLNIRCLFYGTQGLKDLKAGNSLKVKGKVVKVVKDTIVIESAFAPAPASEQKSLLDQILQDSGTDLKTGSDFGTPQKEYTPPKSP